jgi:hypothetical protein
MVFLALSTLWLPALLFAQGERTTIHEYRCWMTPSKENPPVRADAAGNCVIEIVARRDASNNLLSAWVDFRVNVFLGQAETFTGLHIHRAVEGVNGPVVINTGLRTRPGVAGENILFYQVEVTDPMQLGIVTALLANPAGFYCNIHSQTNPSGISRGQLVSAAAANEAVSALGAKIDQNAAAENTAVTGVKSAVDSLATVVRQIAFRLGISLQ